MEETKNPAQTIKEAIEKAFGSLDALLQKVSAGDKLSGSKPSPAKRALFHVRNILFAHEMALAAIQDAMRQISVMSQLTLETLGQKGLITLEDIDKTASAMGLSRITSPASTSQEPKAVLDPIQSEPNSADSSVELPEPQQAAVCSEPPALVPLEGLASPQQD